MTYLDKQKQELEERLAETWKEVETEFRCPHCGTPLDPEGDWLRCKLAIGTSPNRNTYLCPHCGKHCDFPGSPSPGKEEGGDTG